MQVESPMEILSRFGGRGSTLQSTFGKLGTYIYCCSVQEFVYFVLFVETTKPVRR